MLQQGQIAFNTVIKCRARNGLLKETLQLFQQMLQEGLSPNKLTFSSIVSRMAGQATLKEVKWTHIYIIAGRFEFDIMVGTCLIYTYGRCHSSDHARQLFEMMPVKNEVTWNAMISAFAQNCQNEAALFLYAGMVSRGVLPSKITYILVLNICTSMRDLKRGTDVHACSIATAYASDVFIQCILVVFYGKCGSLGNAEKCFNRILVPNVVAWTAMITVYTENGKSEEALRCFSQMREQTVVPNEVTFIILVDLCSKKQDLGMGMDFHSMILSFGQDETLAINNSLIHFYGKSFCVEECWVVFNKMKTKDVISWNGMISACSCSGQNVEALSLFVGLLESGTIPTKATLISIYGACANLGIGSEAYVLHFYALYAGTELNAQIANAVISLYGSCKSLADACMMFQKTTRSDVVAWNALLRAYLQQEDGDGVCTLFHQMTVEGMLPNSITMITVISAFSGNNWLLNEGRWLHACWFLGCKDSCDIALSNALLNMYAKCGSSFSVHKYFSFMPVHDTVSFNVAMSMRESFNQNRHVDQLFDNMLSEGLMPDEGSFVSVLNACAAKEGSLTKVHQMHGRILSRKRYRQNCILQNALMDAYGKCKDLEHAQEVFDELLDKGVVAWNTLLASYEDSRLPPLIFNGMLHQGIMPDEVTYVTLATSCSSQVSVVVASHLHARLAHSVCTFANSVLATAFVKMQGACGQLENATFAFKSMHKRNLFAWNTILRVYAQYGKGKDTLKLLQQMYFEGVIPDKITFVSVLSACGHEGLVAESLHMLCVITFDHSAELIEDHHSCLVDVLGRSGQLDKAEFLLKSMLPQVPSAAAMAYFSACEINADAERAGKVHEWMIEQETNSVDLSLGTATNLIDTFHDDEFQLGIESFLDTSTGTS